jgi:hypothetical protein
MSTVAILPTPHANAARAAINPRNAGTCGTYDIAGRLGQAHASLQKICKTIDALIAEREFPKPYPLVRAGKLCDGVHRDSRWPIVAVDHWFEDLLPPGARAMARSVEQVERDSRLNTNLAHLFDEHVA